MYQGRQLLGKMRLGVMIIVILAVVGLAEANQVVVVDLPTRGHLGEVTEELVRELESRGVELLSAEEMAAAETPPSAIVVDDDRATEAGQAEKLDSFVRAGGGLVLLVGRSRRHLEQANEFLKPRGIEIIADPEARGPVQWVNSALTLGLEPPPSGSLRLRISADKLVPLARQNKRIVSAGMPLGEGGIIVIPTEIVAEGLQQRPPDNNGLRYLVQALSWAERLEELASISPTPSPLPAPSLPTPAETQLPLERRDFAGAILYDSMAREDKWPEINAVIQDALRHTAVRITQLPLKALRVQDAESPLVEALQSNPELVVLGSWREYSEEEIGALHHYVAAGGRLLALAHSDGSRQIRLVYLHQVLVQFGVLVGLGRPGGIAKPAHPSEKPPYIGEIPGGVKVLGKGVQPLIIVDDYIAAGWLDYENGRLAVMDPKPLLTNGEYRERLRFGVIPIVMGSEYQ